MVPFCVCLESKRRSLCRPIDGMVNSDNPFAFGGTNARGRQGPTPESHPNSAKLRTHRLGRSDQYQQVDTSNSRIVASTLSALCPVCAWHVTINRSKDHNLAGHGSAPHRRVELLPPGETYSQVVFTAIHLRWDGDGIIESLALSTTRLADDTNSFCR